MAEQSRRSSRFSMRSKQIGQLLLENGDVQAEQVNEALNTQTERGGLLGQILTASGACTATAVSAALLKQVQVTDVRCDDVQADAEVMALVPRETCEAERLCPFERLGNLLCVVMGNPLNRKAITEIEQKSRLKVKSFKAPWPKIMGLIERSYAAGGAEASPGDENAVADIGAIGDEPIAMDLGDGGSSDVAADIAAPVEISPPDVEAPAAAAPASSAPRASSRIKAPEAPQQAKVKGMDDLDESRAEVIEVDNRGMSARHKKIRVDEPAPAPKPRKIAKVNVNLDDLDIVNAGEVVGDPDDPDYEEISHVAASAKSLARVSGEAVVTLRLVDDDYFYNGGKAPRGERSDELLDIIEKLPVAEVIAESIGDYESQLKSKARPAEAPVLKDSSALKGKPVELQPSPAAKMAPILISEAEFQKQVSQLGEDPVGEWDWQFAAAGPVPVQAYEE